MGINQEAILKCVGHIQSLLKVCVFPHKLCQHGTPLRVDRPPVPTSAWQQFHI